MPRHPEPSSGRTGHAHPSADNPSGDSPSFGSLLRQFRESAGLARGELAERADLSLEAISAYERGTRRSPYAHTLGKLAGALGLTGGERARLIAAAGRKWSSEQPGGAHPQRPTPPAAHWTSILPPFVGRTRELAWVASCLQGWRPLLRLAGEPGMGKTRLLREAVSQARKRGWQVLWGTCPRSGREPYASVVEALQGFLRTVRDEDRRNCLRGCDGLSHLLPEFVVESATRLSSYEERQAREQQQLFTSVERLLSNVAGAAGTLLVLDDAQWIGPDTLALLERLVRGQDQRRIRVLVAYRSTEVLPGHPLSDLLAELARNDLVEPLVLPPLKHDEALTLAETLLRDAPLSSDPREVRAEIDRLVERCGGVPFYLVSCADVLRTQARRARRRGQQPPARAGEADSAVTDAAAHDAQGPAVTDAPDEGIEVPEHLPRVVWQAVNERVARLSSAAHTVLDAAAILAQPASSALLAAVSGLDEDAALEALESAYKAKLVDEAPANGTRERYQFKHELVREVIEAGLLAGRRRWLHRRAAEALERDLSARTTADTGDAASHAPFARLAYHFARADLPEKAATYLRQAADRARQMYAHQEAADHYRDLVACLERLGRRREAAQARWDMAMELSRAGRLEAALAALHEAERAYAALGETDAHALVTAAIGNIHVARGTTAEGLAMVDPLLQGLTTEATATGAQTSTRLAAPPALPTSPEAQARLYGALACLAFVAGRYHDALAAAERALAIAHEIHDERLLARFSLPCGVALHGVGRTPEAIAHLVRAVEGADAARDLDVLAESLRMLSWTYQTHGAFAASLEVQPRAIASSAQVADMTGLGQAVFLDGLLAFYVGNWAKARTIAEQAIAMLENVELSYLSAYGALGLGWLNLVEGHAIAADEYLERARTIARQSGGDQVLRLVEAVLAERDLLAGQPQAARARLDPFFDGTPLQVRTRVELDILRAWAAVDLGAQDEAESLVRSSIRAARAHEIFLALPDALRVEGLWAMRRRDWPTAERALDEARVHCAAMPYPYAEAKVLYVYGQVRASQGDIIQARALFAEAQARCADLGERLYAEHIERALAALAP